MKKQVKTMKERLKQIRKHFNYTQEEMAKKLGYTQGAYAKLENGTAKIGERHILLLANTFNIDEEWFKTGTGDMFTKQACLKRLSVTIDKLNASNQKYLLNLAETMLADQGTPPSNEPPT